MTPEWHSGRRGNISFGKTFARKYRYVRETQVIVDSLAKNPPAQNEVITAFWSKGFRTMWDAGNSLNQQATAVAKEAVELIDKASIPVTKA